MNQDARQIIAESIHLSTDETTILRTEPVRLRVSIYSGTTDADSQTNINLVGIEKSAIVVGISTMILSASSANNWFAHDIGSAAASNRTYRVILVQSSNRQIALQDVGTDLQGQSYRVTVWWLERI